VVVGSGAAGLSAAVTAAHKGLRVTVLEKDNVLGGATAWSGGWMWVPLNPLAKRAGIHEDPDQVRTYLHHELGSRYKPELIDSFLANAGPMVSFFEANTALQFAEGNAIPDIHGDVPGAATGGHQVIAAPFDARELGNYYPNLRKTMAETSFLGMPIQAGKDLTAFLNCTRSLSAFFYVAGRFTRHLWHLLRYGRAMYWVNGIALVGRLVKSALELGIDLRTSSSVTGLIQEQGQVLGVTARSPDGDINIRATRGVVLAAGGFAYDIERRKQLLPRTPTGREHWPLPPTSVSGDGLRLGESVGGRVATDLASAAAWAPVSLVPSKNGKSGHFPHIIDRAKPGVIGVLANGRRFVNEANGYYDYVAAMLGQVPEGEEVASWLICDHRALRRYGLGIVRPAPVPYWLRLRDGYLKRGKTLAELAEKCGIDGQALTATVEQYNRTASEGIDPLFGKGTTPYNRKMGDAGRSSNPCNAPLAKPPFYAVKVVPGSFGTFAGLVTDGNSRVLNSDNEPVPGLYAAGTDMASIMGGYYPSGGINLGPAMTFGYIAGCHAAASPAPEKRSP